LKAPLFICWLFLLYSKHCRSDST